MLQSLSFSFVAQEDHMIKINLKDQEIDSGCEFDWYYGGVNNMGFCAFVMHNIIQFYSTHELPVAPNVMRAMVIIRDTQQFDFEYQLNINKLQNPLWHMVEEEINKYLLFS